MTKQTVDGGLLIEPSSDKARQLNIPFTNELFWGYLSKKDNSIYISMIASKKPGKGNMRRLLDSIEDKGYTVKIPTPSNRMRKICEIRGYKRIIEDTPFGGCEVYISTEEKSKTTVYEK